MAKTGPKPRSLQDAWDFLLENRVINGECWLYELGYPVGIGYRRIRAGGRDWYVHELSDYLFGGDLPEGLVRRHTCHKPNCFRPEHIIHGTHADNIADKVSAGRQSMGVRHYKSILTEDDVRAIRKSSANLGELSREFGISRGGILKIRNRESWKHVID